MADSKEKIITIRVDEELHKLARVRVAELDTSFQQVLGDLLRRWARGEVIAGERAKSEPSAVTISREDAALVEQLLDFWRHPHDAMDTKVRNLLAEVLEVREKHAKHRRKSTA